MKELTLEDMTKGELIKIILGSLAYQPTQKQMQLVRWKSMVEQAQALAEESIKEQKLYSGMKDMGSHFKWLKASEKFDRSMKLHDKADAFYLEMEEGR